MKKQIKIAFVGQPNVGKSSLINAISNANLHVGNFAGVTVEKIEIETKFCDPITKEEYEIKIIDLPGSYSLNDYTAEEKVTKEFLLKEEYDLIVNVVDSTHLQRNLLLTAELMELGKKMILVLNMIDEAKKEGIIIDDKQLQTILGIPVVKVSAKTKEGINELLEKIVEVYNKEKTDSKIIYSDFIEEEITKIINFFKERHYKSDIPLRHLAVRLLKEDKVIYKKMHDEPIWIELLPLLRNSLEHIYLHSGKKDISEIFADEHFAFAKGAKMEVISTKSMRARNITQKIDNFLINQYFGIPIFLFLMWGLFQLTFSLGAIPMEQISSFFDWLSSWIKNSIGGELGSLIGDGILGGVGAVISFLPNILILFFGIALLETTGYMARVAFLLDGFFHKFGLHGKSFIPLVTGFGCTVPAYMATRTLKSRSDRLITLFILGFMSCSARIPVYVLFAGAFFGAERAGNILFLIYIIGAILGLIAAKILRKFFFKGEDDPFVMEMPKYRLPSVKLIFHIVWGQAKDYLKKAGTFILIASALIWWASNYPKNPQIVQSFKQEMTKIDSEEKLSALKAKIKEKELENSYLGKFGKFSEPFFAPLGFDWKLAVSLEAGLGAKEIIVSTLGVLYSLGDEVDEKSNSLQTKIKEAIPISVGLAFIVFVMVYIPCVASMAVFVKEAGGWKYLGYLFLMTTATAWILSFITYNLTKILVGE
jgi:ferrous iron transport protein B